MNTKKVNRVEVIDHTKSLEKGGGRAYVKWEKGIQVTLDLQDEERTLKIFIKEEDKCGEHGITHCGECDYKQEEFCQKQDDLAIICANLCCSGVKSCKECPECEQPEKTWEEQMPLYLTSAGDRRRTTHFIKQLLSQQLQSLRKKIEARKKEVDCMDVDVSEKDGYNQAISELLKILEEDGLV